MDHPLRFLNTSNNKHQKVRPRTAGININERSNSPSLRIDQKQQDPPYTASFIASL